MSIPDTYLYGTEKDELLAGAVDTGNYIYGQSGSDTLQGGELRDHLYGGAGPDLISGAGGNDELSGEYAHEPGANDTLMGEQGNDRLEGGGGDDSLFGGDGEDTLHGGDGSDSLLGGIGDDWLSGDDYFGVGEDTLLGEQGNDVLNGYAGGDLLKGGSGDDRLYGDETSQAGGSDTLLGGQDNDLLFGVGGNDNLAGGDGNDSLWGQDGDDVLSGGNGVDLFVVSATNTGVDRVLDFTPGEDWLVFQDSAGRDTPGFVSSGAFTTGSSASTAKHHFIFNPQDSTLYYDADGNGAEAMIALVSVAGVSLQASNLFVDADGQLRETLRGTSGDDRLEASPAFGASMMGDRGDDTLIGGSGRDSLDGGGGSNSVSGGSGNDELRSNNFGASGDTLDGGSGDDSYYIVHQAVIIDDSGVDAVRYSGSAEYFLTAGQNIETLYGNGSAAVHGNEYANYISGAASIYGEGGDDSIYDAALAYGGDGDDHIYDTAVAYGGDGNDYLHVGRGSYSPFNPYHYDGGAGDDHLLGGGGIDAFQGGEGDDHLQGDWVALIEILLDKFSVDFQEVWQWGELARFAPDDVLGGNAGVDHLQGEMGSDLMFGGTGDDFMQADEDVVMWSVFFGYDLSPEWQAYLGSLYGNDFLSGGQGNDSLYGGAGHDTLRGDEGSDLLVGGEGRDVFVLAPDADAASVDTIHQFVSGKDVIHVVLGSDSGIAAGAIAANVFGTGEANSPGQHFILAEGVLYFDTDGNGPGGLQALAVVNGDVVASDIVVVRDMAVEGTAAADALRGRAGDDVLVGWDGDDLIVAGKGDDQLIGTLGSDSLQGGAGNDRYVVDADDVVSERAGEGRDTVVAMSDWTLSDNVEVLEITMSAVSGTGNSLANLIVGNGVANVLSGLGGNDVLRGNFGNDTLDGGQGADLLLGGKGADTLTGGADADVFRFAHAPASGEVDVITDFVSGTDRIELGRIAFQSLAVGELTSTQFVSGVTAMEVDDCLLYDAVSGALYYDADGNGEQAAVAFARIGEGAVLVASDITVA